MKTLVISDLHLNPSRQGGTTVESRNALEEWQFEQLELLLYSLDHDRLVINGDLFDKYTVSDKTMLKTFELLEGEKQVVIVRGNHDSVSMKYGDICSLELLGKLLPNTRVVFHEPYTVADMHFIPHCFSQEQFDAHINNCPKDMLVFLHCNYDNHFAVEADHSLNLSKQQFDKLVERDCKVILGHEHAFCKTADKIHLGCTFPTSIADCLSGNKQALLIGDDKLEVKTVWRVEEDYIELPHTDIKLTDHKFARINGECSVAEYPAIVREVAELRRKSEAFVISNNVKIKVSETEVLSAEEVTNFNIIDLLLERIDPDFKEDVESCL